MTSMPSSVSILILVAIATKIPIKSLMYWQKMGKIALCKLLKMTKKNKKAKRKMPGYISSMQLWINAIWTGFYNYKMAF